jgi:bifunctional oligoribonuclease and PAP phosphatase NrnA
MINFKKENTIKKDILQLSEKILESDRILLVGHRNPDGDTIGSMTAMIEYLNSINKKFAGFILDPVPENLDYLKHSSLIENDTNLLDNSYDLVICLDCADMKYTGIEDYLFKKKEKGVCIVNIDHHPGSDYGEINIVDDQSSSTSVIVYEIFKFLEININSHVATSLLAGVLVDTNNFSNSGTNNQSMLVASKLVELGGRYGFVNRKLYQNYDENSFRLWSRVLKRLKKNDRLKIAYSIVLSEDVREVGSEAVDGLANFFNHMRDSRVTMILKEVRDGEIKVSLRANEGAVDVARLARVFGGGGHKKAAGFTIAGRLERQGFGWKII